jgi:16S rRNA processing protein RimM
VPLKGGTLKGGPVGGGTPLEEGLILVGVVARPHGLRGQVIVNPETDFAEERFAPGATVLLSMQGRLQPMTVTSLRFHQGRPIVGFDGVESIEAAEPLAQQALWIREADRPALADGRYYHSDLVGCEVRTTTAAVVGQVTRVQDEGGTALLVVGGEGRDEVLVPLVDRICVEIDAPGRRIIIDPPDGLLDLNRSTAAES